MVPQDPKVDFNGMFTGDRELKRRKKQQRDEQATTLRGYLDLVQQDPKIAQSSASRLYEIIMDAGTEEIPEEERWWDKVNVRYNLFSKHLFGVEKPIFQIVKFIEEAALGLPLGRQILLLVGPTGSGKSNTVDIIKRALEDYNKRPIFALEGCQKFDEPLWLLPRYLRRERFNKEKAAEAGLDRPIEDILNIPTIKGDICPRCKHRMETEFANEDGSLRLDEFPVVRFTFSVSGSRGIGTIEPADEKSEDVQTVLGIENMAITQKDPSNPLGWELVGALMRAGRGILEGVELVKYSDQFLRLFISVAQEGRAKIQGSTFPQIEVDVMVMGHTNTHEYRAFSTNQTNEALHDRIYVVAFPYTLVVNEEVRIYEKLIRDESAFESLRRCHIAPGALKMAAMFAVMTRLKKSEMVPGRIAKMKVYNNEWFPDDKWDAEPVDVRWLVEESQKYDNIAEAEGMSGVSPRDVMAALSIALVEQEEEGCLTPTTVIQALNSVFEHRMGYTPEEIQEFRQLLTAEEGDSVETLRKDWIMEIVSKSFLRAYRDLAETLYRKYLEETRIFRNLTRQIPGQRPKLQRDRSGKIREPDTKFLKSVERHMGVTTEDAAKTVRGNILEVVGELDEGEVYTPLMRAVEQRLMEDAQATLSLVLDPDRPKSEEANRRAEDLFSTLMERGHCQICAREAIEEAAKILAE